MKHLTILLLSLLVLAGCATPTPPDPIIKIKTVVIAPEDNLLLDCDVQVPPVIKDYIALPDWQLKEGVLVDMNEKNLFNLNVCNIRFKKLREWKAQQLLLYTDKKS